MHVSMFTFTSVASFSINCYTAKNHTPYLYSFLELFIRSRATNIHKISDNAVFNYLQEYIETCTIRNLVTFQTFSAKYR